MRGRLILIVVLFLFLESKSRTRKRKRTRKKFIAACVQVAADYEAIRRSWYLGSEQFRQELLAAASERVGLSH